MTSSVYSECLRDPSKDYAQQFEIDVRPNLLSIPIKLSTKGPEILMLAEKSSCGAHSCEYAGYVKDAEGCFYRVITFMGSFELGLEGPIGLKSIVVHESQLDGSRKSCDWNYNILRKVMVQSPSTCKKTKVN